MTRHTFLRNSLPALALLGVFTAAAHADTPLVQLTLDTPNLTVPLSSSGDTQYFFTGTITNLTGDTLSYSGSTLGKPAGPGGQIETTVEPFAFPTAPNSSFSGDLFSFIITPSTKTGVYGGGAAPATFSVQGFDTATQQIFNVPANFTVTVGSPVPEASTTVSFGLLLALGLGGAVMAAKKKKAA